MFVFNEKTGKLLNLDMVSEVLVGREKNKLTIARENGAMGIFTDYSTETEAREALWKLMEYEDTELSPENIRRPLWLQTWTDVRAARLSGRK